MGRGGVKGLLMVWLVVVWGWAWASAADNPAEECKDDFQKVMSCLEFATGKATVPTKDCCTAVEGIKEDDPKCLCFIIQQTHSGGQTIRSLGIQEAKLLQLPSACHLKNATVSNCPSQFSLSLSLCLYIYTHIYVYLQLQSFYSFFLSTSALPSPEFWSFIICLRLCPILAAKTAPFPSFFYFLF